MALPREYYSVDVECVATGRRHDDRSVAFVALVDQNERLLYKEKVRVDKPIMSYLTPLTGLRRGDLDYGKSLDTVIKDIKRFLGPNAVLVGQGVKSDIGWLHLQEGIDFKSSVDLGDFFKVYNPRYNNYSHFSLQHEANILLGPGNACNFIEFISGPWTLICHCFYRNSLDAAVRGIAWELKPL